MTAQAAPNKWLVRLATFFKYALGVLLWAVLLDVLSVFGGFNAWSFVDGLGMRKLNDQLVQNTIGDVAYRAAGGYGDHGSGPRYIYMVSYQPHGKPARRQVRSLTSLVDVKSWHFVSASGIDATYQDVKHSYIVRSASDGTDIDAEDK